VVSILGSGCLIFAASPKEWNYTSFGSAGAWICIVVFRAIILTLEWEENAVTEGDTKDEDDVGNIFVTFMSVLFNLKN
jgi:hypothetical protein